MCPADKLEALLGNDNVCFNHTGASCAASLCRSHTETQRSLCDAASIDFHNDATHDAANVEQFRNASNLQWAQDDLQQNHRECFSSQKLPHCESVPHKACARDRSSTELKAKVSFTNLKPRSQRKRDKLRQKAHAGSGLDRLEICPFSYEQRQFQKRCPKAKEDTMSSFNRRTSSRCQENRVDLKLQKTLHKRDAIKPKTTTLNVTKTN